MKAQFDPAFLEAVRRRQQDEALAEPDPFVHADPSCPAADGAVVVVSGHWRAVDCAACRARA